MTPTLIKDTYTTGSIAKLCRVAPRTVSKWCDSGLLECHLVPCSKDRRVTRRNLITFMKREGMPAEYIATITPGRDIVFCGLPGETAAALGPAIEAAGLTPHFAANPFAAGVQAASLSDCAAIAIDVSIGRIEVGMIAQAVADLWPGRRPSVVAVVVGTSPDAYAPPPGFDAVITVANQSPGFLAEQLRILIDQRP